MSHKEAEDKEVVAKVHEQYEEALRLSASFNMTLFDVR